MSKLDVESLLREAVERRASDIHLEPEPDGHHARLRVGETLVDALGGATLPADVVQHLAERCGLLREPLDKPRVGALDADVAGHVLRFRATALPTARGLLLALHRPADVRPDLTALGMPAPERLRVEQALLGHWGLVVFSGRAGSGKTSSLQTSLVWTAAQQRLVLSAEHPVETRLPGVHQVELDPDRGLDAEAVTPGLLLQDADLIGFDEIRDWRAARAAVRVAHAGQTAAATLAARSSADVVSRLFNFGIEPFLVINTLRTAVAQRLLPRLCRACRRPAVVSVGERATLEAPSGQRAFTAPGCAECGGSGRQGRIAVFEVLALTPPIQQLIIYGASTAELHVEAVKLGLMTTLRSQGLALADLGEVTAADVLRLTPPDLGSLSGDSVVPVRELLFANQPDVRERIEHLLEQHRQTRDGEIDSLAPPR